jgi:hypothetical protein
MKVRKTKEEKGREKKRELEHINKLCLTLKHVILPS